jgi:hypothetical protein
MKYITEEAVEAVLQSLKIEWSRKKQTRALTALPDIFHRLRGNMTQEDNGPTEKAARVAWLDSRIDALVTEWYSLVAPTYEEVEESNSLFYDDIRAEAECCLDPNCTIGKLYLGSEAQTLREFAREEGENEKEKSGDGD